MNLFQNLNNYLRPQYIPKFFLDYAYKLNLFIYEQREIT